MINKPFFFLTKWKVTNAIFDDAEVKTECSDFEATCTSTLNSRKNN